MLLYNTVTNTSISTTNNSSINNNSNKIILIIMIIMIILILVLLMTVMITIYAQPFVACAPPHKNSLEFAGEFCNSQCLSHFAAPFIVVRAETSVAESCKRIKWKSTQKECRSKILMCWLRRVLISVG